MATGLGDQCPPGVRARADAAEDLHRHAEGASTTQRRRCAPPRRGSPRRRPGLPRRKAASPVAGTVQQIYYRPGETVPAGRPVLALLPPGNIKIRFFVPEAMLPKVALGDAVPIHCDGCKADVPAA